jgi:hypothetical protein
VVGRFVARERRKLRLLLKLYGPIELEARGRLRVVCGTNGNGLEGIHISEARSVF